jgi:hypothetical protein
VVRLLRLLLLLLLPPIMAAPDADAQCSARKHSQQSFESRFLLLPGR